MYCLATVSLCYCVNLQYRSKKSPEKQKLNFSRSTLFNMKTRVSLNYFVNNCLFKIIINVHTQFIQFIVTIIVTVKKIDYSACNNCPYF